MISDNGPQFVSEVFEHLSYRLDMNYIKTAVYRPQSNRTKRVHRDLFQMIASFVNDNYETWDQFLKEFTYALRMTVLETTGKTPKELFLSKKLITPFQKLVIVTDGAGFGVGHIEKLFRKARQNTRI
ncbi:retrovirus-related Pol polyprotein from transposon 17.6 [Trichonephila clavipes]|nr:retrovirus-related Pol polyprotein from transposon 17.6 [Trichonephila clavipes]